MKKFFETIRATFILLLSLLLIATLDVLAIFLGLTLIGSLMMI